MDVSEEDVAATRHAVGTFPARFHFREQPCPAAMPVMLCIMTESNPPQTPDTRQTHEHHAAAMLAQAWHALQQGTADAKHAYHLAVLSTMPGEATSDSAALMSFPESRTVVLRWVDPVARTLGCHTDVRCHKVEQVRANPATTWVVYDPNTRIQLRIAGHSTIHADDAFADERWNASELSSRRCYLAARAPSSAVNEPDPNLPADLLHRRPTETEAAPGRKNFAALATQIYSLEVLHLTHDGHQRIRFTWTPDAPSDTAFELDMPQDGRCWAQWLLP